MIVECQTYNVLASNVTTSFNFPPPELTSPLPHLTLTPLFKVGWFQKTEVAYHRKSLGRGRRVGPEVKEIRELVGHWRGMDSGGGMGVAILSA